MESAAPSTKNAGNPAQASLSTHGMGQQSNKIQKRNRRKEYLKRKKKIAAAPGATTAAKPAKAAAKPAKK